jgi:serine/threonine protein kinase
MPFRRTTPQLSTEIKIHRSLEHKHVVKFHRFFEDKDYVYILLELCTNKVRFIVFFTTQDDVGRSLSSQVNPHYP